MISLPFRYRHRTVMIGPRIQKRSSHGMDLREELCRPPHLRLGIRVLGFLHLTERRSSFGHDFLYFLGLPSRLRTFSYSASSC